MNGLIATWLDSAGRDAALAVRRLRQSPGFTLTAVLTLATGIAGISLTFALVNGVLLRPIRVRDQDRLLLAWTELRSQGVVHWPFRVTEIQTIRESSRRLDGVAGVSHNGAGELVALENNAASYLRVAPVMGDFFQALGLNPILGRALSREDDVTGAENVLVITHRLWSRRYGRSDDALGAAAAARRTPVHDRRRHAAGGRLPGWRGSVDQHRRVHADLDQRGVPDRRRSDRHAGSRHDHPPGPLKNSGRWSPDSRWRRRR